MVSDPPPPPQQSPDTTDIALLVFTGINWHKAAVENPTADGSCGAGALRLLKELKRDNANDVRSESDIVRLAREMAFVHWTHGGKSSEKEFMEKLVNTASEMCRSSATVKQWITTQIFPKGDGADHSAVSSVGFEFASAAVHGLLTQLPKLLQAYGGSQEEEPTDIAQEDPLSEAALNKLGGLLRDVQALLGGECLLFKAPAKPQEEPQGETLWTCTSCPFAENKPQWLSCDVCGAQRSGGHDAAQLLQEMRLSCCIVKEGNHRNNATHEHELQLTDTDFPRVSFSCVTENLDVHSLQLAMILRGWLPVTVECRSARGGDASNRLREMQENETELVEQLAKSMLEQVKGALGAVGAQRAQQPLSMELGIVIRTNMAITSPGHYRVGVLADTYDYRMPPRPVTRAARQGQILPSQATSEQATSEPKKRQRDHAEQTASQANTTKRAAGAAGPTTTTTSATGSAGTQPPGQTGSDTAPSRALRGDGTKDNPITDGSTAGRDDAGGIPPDCEVNDAGTQVTQVAGGHWWDVSYHRQTLAYLEYQIIIFDAATGTILARCGARGNDTITAALLSLDPQAALCTNQRYTFIWNGLTSAFDAGFLAIYLAHPTFQDAVPHGRIEIRAFIRSSGTN